MYVSFDGPLEGPAQRAACCERRRGLYKAVAEICVWEEFHSPAPAADGGGEGAQPEGGRQGALKTDSDRVLAIAERLWTWSAGLSMSVRLYSFKGMSETLRDQKPGEHPADLSDAIEWHTIGPMANAC